MSERDIRELLRLWHEHAGQPCRAWCVLENDGQEPCPDGCELERQTEEALYPETDKPS